MSDQKRDLERGLYGRAVPIRPATGDRSPTECLRGHNLAIAGAKSAYHHRYGLTEITCDACHALGDPLSSWCLIDPAHQYDITVAPHTGLVLARTPPAVRGGTGHIALWIEGVPIADVDLAVCGPCKRAVIEHVRTDTPRQGYGRVLIAAAMTLAPPTEYHWSTTPITDDPIARAFWAGLAWTQKLGEPDYCTDMDRAAGRLPDW